MKKLNTKLQKYFSTSFIVLKKVKDAVDITGKFWFEQKKKKNINVIKMSKNLIEFQRCQIV